MTTSIDTLRNVFLAPSVQHITSEERPTKSRRFKRPGLAHQAQLRELANHV
jgi:hypothetical protein